MGASTEVSARPTWSDADGPMPALYLGHGAPPLVDDEVWTSQLSAWARVLPKPKAVLMVSAHWESAPLTLGATGDAVPLTYDFYASRSATTR
jgi:4,5-DOPA dioxygenase extradiol